MSQEKLVKLLQDLKLNQVPNEWDEHAPVISKGNQHMIYLTSAFEEPSMYNKLCYTLHNANEYDEFIFIINSPGGMLDSTFMVIDAIKNTAAKTTAKLVGTVASASTIIALSCDEVITSSNLAFMIHNYSSAMQGKGHEMKARQRFIDNQLESSFKNYYLGFLSEEEIIDVIDGKDFWFNEHEVNKRWKNKKELDSKGAKNG